jgi:hypothetical protein
MLCATELQQRPETFLNNKHIVRCGVGEGNKPFKQYLPLQ